MIDLPVCPPAGWFLTCNQIRTFLEVEASARLKPQLHHQMHVRQETA